MAVIYLDPKPNIGAGIGNAIGQAGAAFSQSQALNEADSISDPQQKANFLMKRLGPEGAKFVEQLLKVQALSTENTRALADIERAKVETTNAGLKGQQLQFTISHQDEDRKLQIAEERARINASNASAAGSSARVALAHEELIDIRDKRERLHKAMSMMDALSAGPEQPQGGLLNAPSAPGSGGQAPVAIPQSGPGGTPQARPISDSTAGMGQGGPTGGQGSAKIISDSPPARPFTMEFVDQVAQGKDQPTEPTQPSTPDPETVKRMLAARLRGAMKDDPMGGYLESEKIKMEASQPYKTENRPVAGAPGWTEIVGLYHTPSGDVARPIPNSRAPTTLKMAPATEIRAGTGAAMLNQTTQLLKAIDALDTSGTGADPLGGQARRAINTFFIDRLHQDPPFASNALTTISEARDTLLKHGLLGVMQYTSGTRAGQRMVEMSQNLLPTALDTLSIRQQKEAAMTSALKLFVKSTVEEFVESGVAVPESWRQTYNEMGLTGSDIGQLREDYMKSARLTGIPSLVDPTDGSPVAPADRPAAAKAARSAGPGKSALPSGDMITIGKQSYTRSQVEEELKKHPGLTLEDLQKYAQ